MKEIADMLLLIAIGIGYLVIYFAKREDEKLFKLIGYFVGIMLIALAIFYMIMNFVYEARAFGPRMMQNRQMMMRQYRPMPQVIVPQQRAIVPPQK